MVHVPRVGMADEVIGLRAPEDISAGYICNRRERHHRDINRLVGLRARLNETQDVLQDHLGRSPHGRRPKNVVVGVYLRRHYFPRPVFLGIHDGEHIRNAAIS